MKNLKLMFVHDHIFHEDNKGRFYSSGGLPAKTWNRYLKHFQSLTVVARKSRGILSENNITSYAYSSHELVKFELTENISGVHARLKNMRKVRRHMATLVSSHDGIIARLTSELGLLAIKEAQKQGKAWAIELVDCPWDGLWNYGSLKGKIYAPIMALRVKSAILKCTHTLYVTEKFLQKRYPSKYKTVACSNVEIPALSKITIDNRLKKIENKSGKIVFGLIGSLNGRLKGIHTTMEALSKIKSELPPFEFRILGGGDTAPWIKETKRLGIEDIVFFDGVISSGSPVYDWLDNIDIYLHPSFKEGLPRALIEAMSRGCPALASNIAGTPELLTESFLINPGDTIALAQKILWLSSNSDLQINAAIKNFSTAEEYITEKLDMKRDLFWSDFALSCK